VIFEVDVFQSGIPKEGPETHGNAGRFFPRFGHLMHLRIPRGAEVVMDNPITFPGYKIRIFIPPYFFGYYCHENILPHNVR
jgi:hypothetical protein